MFISGHKEVLKDALEELSQTGEDMNFDKTTISTLYKGIIWPDLACFKFASKGTKIKDQEHCWVAKLAKIIHGKYFGFSTIYQFQRGILTILHSMNNSIDIPLKQTRDYLLNMVLGFLNATVSGAYGFPAKSAFWIGVILHMITDSYPKGHTIRQSFYTPPIVQVDQVIEDGVTKKARKQIYKALHNKIKNDSLDVTRSRKQIQKYLYECFNGDSLTSEIRYYLETRMKSIYHTYLIFKLVAKTEEDARLTKQRLNISSDIGISETSTPKPFDILHFQMYDYQGFTFHKMHDFLTELKMHPIYKKRILPEVCIVLKLYHDFLNDKVTADDFIKRTFIFIASHVYRVCRTDLKNTPAFPKHGLSNRYKIKQVSKRL